MTFLSEKNTNEDYVPEGLQAVAPRVGFLRGFETAYEAQRRTAAMYGIERAVQDLQSEQSVKLKNAGLIGNMPWDEDYGPWGGKLGGLDLAKFYEEGGDEETIARYKAYDEKIDEFKTKHPELGLRNTRETWDTVKSKAQEAERRYSDMRTTTSGAFGDFIGGAAASLDPRTDPLNTVTLGLAGKAKTILGGMAAEGGIQGGIEAVNQVTGVQQERRLLGLDHGFDNAITQIGFSAAGGAALRGTGEGLGLAFKYGRKRWFNDQAPPPPIDIPPSFKPEDIAMERQADDFAKGRTTYADLNISRTTHGETRIGAARTVDDLKYTTAKLDEWAGPRPSDLKPMDISDLDLTLKSGIKTVDDAARALDPETFRIYDKLSARKQELRSAIDATTANKAPAESVALAERRTVEAAVDDLTNRIDELKSQRNRGEISNRKLKDLDKRIKQLETERADNMTRIKGSDDPQTASLRQELLDTDIKMRDMAEVVGRTYARARGEWQLPTEQQLSLRRMMRGEQDSGFNVDEPIRQTVPSNAMFDDSTLTAAPILQRAGQVEAKMRPDSDAADYASSIIKEDIKLAEANIERMRTSLDKYLGDDVTEINIAGTELKLNLDTDKIYVPNADGDGGSFKTVREVLEDLKETELDLEATKKCSI